MSWEGVCQVESKDALVAEYGCTFLFYSYEDAGSHSLMIDQAKLNCWMISFNICKMSIL